MVCLAPTDGPRLALAILNQQAEMTPRGCWANGLQITLLSRSQGPVQAFDLLVAQCVFGQYAARLSDYLLSAHAVGIIVRDPENFCVNYTREGKVWVGRDIGKRESLRGGRQWIYAVLRLGLTHRQLDQDVDRQDSEEHQLGKWLHAEPIIAPISGWNNVTTDQYRWRSAVMGIP
jgi:hypothetical protein